MRYTTIGSDPGSARKVSVLSLGALLGRWRASRGIGDEVVIATKAGARPTAPAAGLDGPREGLSRAVIREASERSRERLGMPRIDLYYAHVPDQGVPLDEQVAAFGELVSDGTVGLLGLSNHWAWQVERARRLAAAAGTARADVLQYHHSYLRMRTDIPGRAARRRILGRAARREPGRGRSPAQRGAAAAAGRGELR